MMSVSTPLASYWKLLACTGGAPPDDWRERLVSHLGARPRRIGIFAELALYGALECLQAAGEAHADPALMLRLGSRSCAATATRDMSLQRINGGMPMPFTFLQSQPAQTLAALAKHLEWQGDAVFHISDAPLALLRLACVEAAAEMRGGAVTRCEPGLLLGWVDDLPALSSMWLRLAPVSPDDLPVDVGWRVAETLPTLAGYLRLDASGISVAA